MKPPLFYRPGLSVRRYAAMFDLRPVPEPPRLPGHHLWLDEHGLGLRDEQGNPLEVLKGRDPARRSPQVQLLAQACGASNRLAVADLMAGWGRDGLALAKRGCVVTLVERSPVVWALLDDFVARLGLTSAVVFDSAEQWCRAHPKSVDVAYLDPMFAPRRKTALPAKRMQILRELAWSEGTGLADLIAHARVAARDRVVVKRRAKDRACGVPAWQVRGRRIRFDVYRAGTPGPNTN